MKRPILFLLILLISCGGEDKPFTPALNSLGDNDDLSPGQVELIFTTLQNYPENTQAAFALIKKENITFYGVKRQNDSLVEIRNERSVFEIGSISKVFTSILLADYVINGKVSLDDHINDYLEITINNNISPTFRELSNHTSGFPRMPSNFLLGSLFNRDNPYKNYDEEKLEEFLSEDLELENEPGEKSAYSNLGAGLLGYSLSKVSGMDYQSMLEETIFNPYEMSNSTTKRNEVNESLVSGLDKKGNPTSNWDLNALVAAGGILSTSEDMAKFAVAQFDTTNSVMNLAREVTFSISPTMYIGLGWHIIYSNAGDTLYWHNGATGGYRSSMAVDTDKRNAVIILTNISAFHEHAGNIDDLCFELMASLKEEKVSAE